MSKHAQRNGIARMLLLAVLSTVAAVLRRPRWVRCLRDRLDDRQRLQLVRPLENQTPTRHRTPDDRTVWRETTTRARRLVTGTAAVVVRWSRRPAGAVRDLDGGRTVAVFVGWLRDVVRTVGAHGAPAGWTPGWPHIRTVWRRPGGAIPWQSGASVGNLTGVVGVVVAVLLVSSVVGQVGTAPAPQTLLAAKGFRDNHVGFTRHLLSAPGARGNAAPNRQRSRSASETKPSAAKAKPPTTHGAPKSGETKPKSGETNEKQLSRDRGQVHVQPYIYLNSNHLPDVGAVMRRTGVTDFTLAFVLSNGGCQPVWDGGKHVGSHAGEILSAIRANGGDVVVSFGGWAGRKLGTHCRTPQALARAYQQVIDKYRLRAIDVDIEYREFENSEAQDRVLRALRIVARANPSLTTIVTMPVAKDGLNSWGLRMVRRAAELQVPVDVWTVMPFVLGKPGGDMGKMTIRAAERTHAQLSRFYPGVAASEVYRMLGISSMNGNTGAGETITQADFREIRAYVHRRGLGRFTFWAVNRDLPCPSQGSRPCSGVPQRPWQFTDIVNGVPGSP